MNIFKKKKIYLVPLVGFLIIIVIASILLCMSICNNKPIEYKDALFITISGISTTGLTTLTIKEQFNFLGQLIIAILMEIGAYGFIVIIFYVWSARSKRISFSDMILINDNISSDDFISIKNHLLFIGKVMIKVQMWGAIFYAIRFVPEYGILEGIWYSIFHCISAFSNAGFDILGNTSFCALKNDIYTQIVTIILMSLGNVGILVIEDIVRNKTKRFSKLKLQTKIVLIVSPIIIVLPAFIMFITEPKIDIISSLFMSVTTRSTGFTVYPIIFLSKATRMLLMILMLIGGGPASTSGGIRILPFAVVCLSICSTLKGESQTIIFNRKIPDFTIKKAFVIVLLFLIIILAFVSIFYLVNDVGLFNITFDCISAITNTGLSALDYSNLNLAGECILMILMFIGRIGPLSMFLIFAKDNKKSKYIQYPESNIII